MIVKVDISAAELIDKITILEIKLERISDTAEVGNVRYELDLLNEVRAQAIPTDTVIDQLTSQLKGINTELWEIEDDIRDHDRRGDFGASFVALARRVYRTNDRRSAVKREINGILGSAIVEEKSYAAVLVSCIRNK